MLYIWYPLQFKKDKPKIKALINSGSEVNIMSLIYVVKWGLTTQKTSIGPQKIDGSLLEIYDMVSAQFLLQDSLKKIRFFEETILLANSSMEMVLEILFLSFGNIYI